MGNRLLVKINLSLPLSANCNFQKLQQILFCKVPCPILGNFTPQLISGRRKLYTRPETWQGSIPRNATISLRRDEIPTILFF